VNLAEKKRLSRLSIRSNPLKHAINNPHQHPISPVVSVAIAKSPAQPNVIRGGATPLAFFSRVLANPVCRVFVLALATNQITHNKTMHAEQRAASFKLVTSLAAAR